MRIPRRSLLALLTVALLAGFVHAGDTEPFMYIGPEPYLGFGDSPFLESDQFGFCNETFEDGSFDVPDVTGNGTVLSPAGNIDSVDEDDGVIDGLGRDGHTYFSGSGSTGLTFTFTENRRHGYPTRVGLVWTDGGGGATVTFEAFGPAGESFGQIGPFNHADLSNNGETAEDRFYGITNPEGISAIKVANQHGGIEIDHLQSNRCVACGDTNLDLRRTASDALSALSTSVGLSTCMPCICDTNNSGSITASDALGILQTSVGLGQPLSCPECVLPE